VDLIDAAAFHRDQPSVFFAELQDRTRRQLSLVRSRFGIVTWPRSSTRAFMPFMCETMRQHLDRFKPFRDLNQPHHADATLADTGTAQVRAKMLVYVRLAAYYTL